MIKNYLLNFLIDGCCSAPVAGPLKIAFKAFMFIYEKVLSLFGRLHTKLNRLVPIVCFVEGLVGTLSVICFQFKQRKFYTFWIDESSENVFLLYKILYGAKFEFDLFCENTQTSISVKLYLNFILLRTFWRDQSLNMEDIWCHYTNGHVSLSVVDLERFDSLFIEINSSSWNQSSISLTKNSFS